MQRRTDGLAIGPVDDPYEREADRVAAAVVSGGSAQVSRRVGGGAAQRQTSGAAGGVTAPPIVREALGNAGSPLDPMTRAFMEPRMGHDFSKVRIHSDGRADASARAVNALAYTVGEDIAFRSGQYAPATDNGRRLLAHELAHVVQQDSANVLRRRPQGQTEGGQVTGVRISCEDRQIIFDAAGGSYAYAMTECSIPVGSYSVGVRVQGTTVRFDFGQSVGGSQAFRFGFRVDPGQVNPATLFTGQTQVGISVVDHLPIVQNAPPTTVPAPGLTSLATRVATFKQLVKNAGKARMTQNSLMLEQWRQFLTQQLTPTQVRTQVHAEEVRAVIESAQRHGEMALAERWLQTGGANLRWVQQQQIEGRFHACTGCHATVQASSMDAARAAAGYQQQTPLEQLRTTANEPAAPRPSFAQSQPLTAATEAFPSVAQAQERINAMQPYLQALGPDGYRVLPAETLGSTASASELVAEISRRISQRQADYREFSRRIDAPRFDYLQLRPIVRDLLLLTDADVRQVVQGEIESAETWSFVESIIVGITSIGLLLLAIFPPTSVIGIAGTVALGTAMSAHQIYRGMQSYEQGQLYSLGRGASDVIDREQQDAADTLMAVGALNMVLGSIGVASGVVGGVRLIRSLPPPAGGPGAIEGVEANAGGNLVRLNGLGTRNPTFVETNPSGQIVRQGPISSLRPTATARAPRPSVGGGGTVYGTQGGAARVAVPAVEPVAPPAPAVAPPVTAPVTAPVRPPAPRVAGPIGVMAGTTAARAITSGPLPEWEPSPGASHPTHEEVEDAANETSTDCDAIAYSINVLVRDLRYRRWDMQRHGGGDRIHRDTYSRRQAALRRLIDVARALNCPYDPTADVEVGLPHNHPTPYY